MVEDDAPRDEANVAVVSPFKYLLSLSKSSATSSIVGLFDGESCVHKIPISNNSPITTFHILFISADWSLVVRKSDESTTCSMC